jgi:uncharacterized membrane protein YkvI
VGEDKYHCFVVETAGLAKPLQSIGLLFSPGLFTCLLAITIFIFYPDFAAGGGFWIAMGVITYALILFIYLSANFVRFRNQAFTLQQKQSNHAGQ